MITPLLTLAFATFGVHAQSRKPAPPTPKPGEHLFYQAPPPEQPVPEPPSAEGQRAYGLNTLPVEYVRTHRVYIQKGKRDIFVRVACHEGDVAIRGACSAPHGRRNGDAASHADPSLPVTYGSFRGSRGWVCEYDTSALPDVDDEAAGPAEAIAICVKRKDFMNYQYPARGRGDDF